MIYIAGLVIGYTAGINGLVEKGASRFIGNEFKSPIAGLLSSLGGIVSTLCVIASCYFIYNSYGSSIYDVMIFILSVFIGAVLSGIIPSRTFAYPLSAITLFINLGMAYYIYYCLN